MSENALFDMVPPPAEMKRIGPIFDRDTYIRHGQHSLLNLRKFAYLKPEHSVLDVGCGYGRVAIQLTQFLAPHSRYLGLDVAADEIEWCAANITTRYPIHLSVSRCA